MNKNILMIDDEPVIIAMYSTELQKAGYTTLSLPDPRNFNILMDYFKVDLITLDLMLPYKDGLEFLEEIKQNDKYKDIPIVILTNIDNKDIIDKTIQLGALKYFVLSKIEPQELPKMIDKVFEEIN